MNDTTYRPRHGHATLNRLEKPDDFGNDYKGDVWQRDNKGYLIKHWLNGKKVNGQNGPFLSLKMGKPKTKGGQIVTVPDPDMEQKAEPAEIDKSSFEDDIPF